MDKCGRVGVGEDSWDFAEESFALGVAVGAEAGGDAVEIAVVVAGVAAELVGAGGRERARTWANVPALSWPVAEMATVPSVVRMRP